MNHTVLLDFVKGWCIVLSGTRKRRHSTEWVTAIETEGQCNGEGSQPLRQKACAV